MSEPSELLLSKFSIENLIEQTYVGVEEPVDLNSFTNYGYTINLLPNGLLWAKRLADDFSCSFSVIPIAKPCPHGSTAKKRRPLKIKFLSISSTEAALCDVSGRLWKLDLQTIPFGKSEETSVDVKKLPMSKQLLCVRICAGRSHFLALVRRRRSEETFRKSEEGEDEYFCEDCRQSSRLRLSTLMIEADQMAEELRLTGEDADRLSRVSQFCHSARFRCSNDVIEEDEVTSSSPTGEIPENPKLSAIHKTVSNMEKLPESFDLDSNFLFKDAISLPDAEIGHFTFVSMDRISIRSKFIDKAETTSSQESRTRIGGKKTAGFECLEMRECHEVWSWGANECGQLGHGDTVGRHQPSRIINLDKEFVTDLSCGDDFSMAMTSSGEVFTWGRNNFGQAAEPMILLPKTLRIGADQFAFGLRCSASHAAIQIASVNTSTAVYLTGEGIKASQSAVFRLPLKSKEHLPVRVILENGTVWVHQTGKSPANTNLLKFFHDGCKHVRLTKILWIAVSAAANCFKTKDDVMALEMKNLLSSLAANLEAYFHAFCSVLNDVANELCRIRHDAKVLTKYLTILTSSKCVELLKTCVEDFAACEAFVLFGNINLSSTMKSELSRTSLQYECDSVKVPTQLSQLFGKLVDWTAWIGDFSKKLADSPDSEYFL
ncbi:unnamed protein product [Caenorhabditis auriculariae]|uniref:Uncharacterized protein n=1 Tax=Caenorhabditis auriculariae TaxID=2777116 RepID=A0A8S1H3E6_9PELO|nr:unnamed protein product [Caenorhabditis auriculariae]